MRSMQWQLGILGTISTFARRHREKKKNLCRGGRSQDLPSTDFYPAVRHLNLKKQQYTHSTANTHTMTTIHTRQLQQNTQNNYNNTHKTTNNSIHKTTTTIHTRQLQQNTQDNYNNTHKTTNNSIHKTTTTIHTRQLTTVYTRHLKIQHVQR